MVLDLNWISITVTYTSNQQYHLKYVCVIILMVMVLLTLKDSAIFSSSLRLLLGLEFFFEYIQAPGITISLLSNWQTQTSSVRNGFVIELKQKVEFINQFTFLKSTVSLVPAVLLQGLFCNTFKAPKAFKPTSMINVCSTLVLFIYGSDKINFCFLLILYFHS